MLSQIDDHKLSINIQPYKNKSIMKKLALLILALIVCSMLFSQNVQGFKYQAIIRDAAGNVNANASVNMEISILEGTAEGTLAFSETHSVVSNSFGLVNLTIGSQNPSDFNMIDWANGPYFIKIVVDGIEFGTSQLLSVPYALHAQTAENISGGINETDPVFSASSASGITQTQIENWTNKLSEFAETDPSFSASVAAGITQTQIESWTNKLDEYLETDPEFAASLAKGITVTDTAYWNSKLDDFVESDPTFMAHPSAGITADDITKWKALWVWYTTNERGYLTTETDPVFNASVAAGITQSQIEEWTNKLDSFLETDPVFNASIAKGITAADTTNWNKTNYSKLTNAPDLANTTNSKVIKLNTNDQTSSIEIQKSNGSNVFKVNGAGQMMGDGSGLKNVKSLINYVGGNQRFQVQSNYASYDNVRSVVLTVPANGVCFVMASGFIRWESTGWDLYLGGLLMDKDPNSSWAAENEWYSYLNLITDYNCTDSSDQYTSFAQHRCFPVTEGAHTFTLWVNKYNSSSITELQDVNLTVIYIPTGGSGLAPQALMVTKEMLAQKSETVRKRIERSIDGSSEPPDQKLSGEDFETQRSILEDLQKKYGMLEDKLNQLLLEENK